MVRIYIFLVINIDHLFQSCHMHAFFEGMSLQILYPFKKLLSEKEEITNLKNDLKCEISLYLLNTSLSSGIWFASIFLHLVGYLFTLLTHYLKHKRFYFWWGLVNQYFLLLVLSVTHVRILEWVAILFSRAPSQPRDQTQGSNPGLLHCRWILYSLSHLGSLYVGNHHLKSWRLSPVFSSTSFIFSAFSS